MSIRRPIYILATSLALFIHSILYPPEVIVLRLIEMAAGTLLFMYSITRITRKIAR